LVVRRWSFSPNEDTFVWLKGSSSSNSGAAAESFYGAKGVSTAANLPYPRSGGVGVTDAQGRLWLHGGGAVNAAGNSVTGNDLWRYSVENNQWCWVAGSDDTVPWSTSMFGQFRVTSGSNQIPGRIGHTAVMDTSVGRMYLFGGAVVGGKYATDLWAYDIANNVSTWISGSSTASPPSSYPSFKGAGKLHTNGVGVVSPAMWLDPSGGIYFGLGYCSGWGSCNDLWYIPSPATFVSVELIPTSATARIFSPVESYIRTGINNITVGWHVGFTANLDFSVRGDDGVSGPTFSVRIVQEAPPI
jgi:hypothetical protein